MLDLLTLSDDFSSDSIVAERDELRVTKEVIDRPLNEFDHRYQLRLEPAAPLHLLSGQTVALCCSAHLWPIARPCISGRVHTISPRGSAFSARMRENRACAQFRRNQRVLSTNRIGLYVAGKSRWRLYESLSHEAKINQQVLVLAFGDRWEEQRRSSISDSY